MSRAVSTWVIAIITVCFAFMQFGSLKLIFDDPFNMFDGSASSMVTFDRLDGVSAVSTFLQNSNVLIILAVFVVLFANAEHKCGFDKNLIGLSKNRWKQILTALPKMKRTEQVRKTGWFSTRTEATPMISRNT